MKKQTKRTKNEASDDEEEEEEEEEEEVWPTTLPKLLARIEGKPISYQCQWRRYGGPKEVHSIFTLVEHYGERIVNRVNKCDKDAEVEFVAEKIVDERKDEYLVRWTGYPQEFDTWESAKEKNWEARDEKGGEEETDGGGMEKGERINDAL